jgi:hypothetical protein
MAPESLLQHLESEHQVMEMLIGPTTAVNASAVEIAVDGFVDGFADDRGCQTSHDGQDGDSVELDRPDKSDAISVTFIAPPFSRTFDTLFGMTVKDLCRRAFDIGGIQQGFGL